MMILMFEKIAHGDMWEICVIQMGFHQIGLIQIRKIPIPIQIRNFGNWDLDFE